MLLRSACLCSERPGIRRVRHHDDNCNLRLFSRAAHEVLSAMQTSQAHLKLLFEAIEHSVIAEGRKLVPDLQAVIDDVAKNACIDDSDDKLFHKLVLVVFYSGFRAATVTAKKDIILRHLGDWTAVKDYGPADVERVLADPQMIAMRAKVEACVHNAKEVAELVKEHRSFAAYLRSLKKQPVEVAEKQLKTKFMYLGGITVNHYLMMLGFDVLKPDRVIMRVFHRLGLVQGRDRYDDAIAVGRLMAAATNTKIRRVDRVVVAFGQVETKEFGLTTGICLEERPRCEACGVTAHCSWYRDRHT